MDILKRYSVPFKGLKPGRHEFDFEVDDTLFQAFESTDIRSGHACVHVVLDRSAALLDLGVTIEGTVTVPCDRCLEPCTLPVDYRGRLLVKCSDEPHDYDGDVLWISPAEESIDLAPYLFESIVLGLPYQRIHARGACDPDMMARFRIVSEEEFGHLEAEAEAVKEEGLSETQRAKLATLKARLERKQE